MAMAAAMLATAIARVMLPTARWGWCDLRKREMHGGNDADARSAGHLRLLLLLMLPGGAADVRLLCNQCSVGASGFAGADAGAGVLLVPMLVLVLLLVLMLVLVGCWCWCGCCCWC